MNIEMHLSCAPSLQVVLDSVQANIFIADQNLKLVYMNPKAKQTLKKMENEIFEVFRIRVEDFIGESIHQFHKDPKHVERILRTPGALPHEAIFEFGNIHLRTSINSIVGRGGKFGGYIVNWVDVSEKMALLDKISKKNEWTVDMAKLLLDLENIESRVDTP
jgi:methyl-accepting chemotaxis protein